MLAPCPPSVVNEFSVPFAPFAPKGTVFANLAVDKLPEVILLAFREAVALVIYEAPFVNWLLLVGIVGLFVRLL